MAWIAGVDGCKGGWVAALRELSGGEVVCARFDSVASLLASPYAPQIVAIDMPIGLMDAGPRAADSLARKLLPSRASGIFPTPIRPVLGLTDFWEANRKSREITGKGLNRQSFNIMAKIRELDSIVRASPAGHFRESWPELAFWGLNEGTPLVHSKRTPAGLAERRALLSPLYGEGLARAEAQRRGGVALDDLYDALALLETASRIADGRACRIPEPPPLDSVGLPMEIVYFGGDGRGRIY